MVQIVDIEVCDTIPYAAKPRDTSKTFPCACQEACTGITSVLRCKALYGIVPITLGVLRVFPETETDTASFCKIG
jgi:hypothetical protein